MNEWQDADGINQPVADGVRVDVMFADSDEVFTDEQADYWEWDMQGFDNPAAVISKWRYAESGMALRASLDLVAGDTKL